MSVVATPRRQPLHDRQPLCPAHPPPTTLAIDLMSPTANKRRRHVASATANVQSASRSTAPSSQPHSGSSKRSREDDGDVAATAVTPKRCRLQRGVIATPTKAQSREARTLLPSPPMIHVDNAPSASKDAKRKYTKEERIQREREITNFKEKYTKAFPNFRFYFHGLDAGLKKELSAKVKSLGGRVEDFFSGNVTHLISNRARPTPDHAEGLDKNKENVSQNRSGKSSSASLKSPIQLKSPRKASLIAETATPSPTYDPLVLKAIQLSIKLWDPAKLESMLSRLLSPPPKTEARKRPTATTARPKSLQSLNTADRSNVTLSHLLQAEKQAGITNERDPKAKRPDYAYFPKHSYFLLVQDCDEAYAPVAVKDYGRWKKGDKPTWPVLNLDGTGYTNRGRAPVFGWKPEMDQAPARKPSETNVGASRKPDLRKAVSLHGLNRKRASISGENLLRPPSSFLRPDATGTGSGSFAPSKYNSGASRPSFGSVSLASGLPSQGYVAASGNSAILTSNIASTTSTTGLVRGEADIIPGRKALHRQVVMNRTFGRQQTVVADGKDNDVALIEADSKAKDHAVVRPHVLRKSKSTNTMRLPPREETKKPGYCENCRAKFEDFAKHIKGSRHTRFANNANNFMDLDDTLARVRRKTLDEWQLENEFDLSDSSSDSSGCESGDSDEEDDVTFHGEAHAITEETFIDDDGLTDFYDPHEPTDYDDGDVDELALKREDVQMDYSYVRGAREHEPEWDGVDADEEDELSAF
ncbi:hypothetical protein FRC04_004230 [Tulasnella sp. 424]|nr:hypothetical protein FRC04_004230 [Tulasnella sp. 424]